MEVFPAPPADLVRVDVRYTRFSEAGIPTCAAIQAETRNGAQLAFEVTENVRDVVNAWRCAVHPALSSNR